MSIARLRQMAARQLPLDISDEREMDELRVLMAANLVAGLQLRLGKEPGGPGQQIVRVLAITPEGMRLLQRDDVGTSAGAAAPAPPDH